MSNNRDVSLDDDVAKALVVLEVAKLGGHQGLDRHRKISPNGQSSAKFFANQAGAGIKKKWVNSNSEVFLAVAIGQRPWNYLSCSCSSFGSFPH